MQEELATAPATCWDRLVAILECVDPEHVLAASHIIERGKQLGAHDLRLFYLLALRYQEHRSPVLGDVLNLYVLMSTWVSWLKSTRDCFASLSARAAISHLVFPDTLVRVPSFHHVEKSDGGPLRRPCLSNSDSSSLIMSISSLPSLGECHIAVPNDKLCSSSHSSMAGLPETKANSQDTFTPGCTASLRTLSFKEWIDMGDTWEWDGTLNFVRDGKFLLSMVQMALTRRYRKESEGQEPAAMDADFFLRPGEKDGHVGNTFSFDTNPTTITPHPNLSGCREVCAGSDKSEVRLTLTTRQMLELMVQHGSNIREISETVDQLNYLCETYLGWDPSQHGGEPFFKLSNIQQLLCPLNLDDLYLISQLHWLSLALYHAVGDPTIIPMPPRVSCILYNDNSSTTVDTSEEDNEIGMLIATKCSCLPHSHNLDITVHNKNFLNISHPVVHPQPLCYPCTVVEGALYVYMTNEGVFFPFWWLLQAILWEWDKMKWYFELSDVVQGELEVLLAAPIPPPAYSGAVDQPAESRRLSLLHLNAFIATPSFELTVPGPACRRSFASAVFAERRDPTEAATYGEGALPESPSAHVFLESTQKARGSRVGHADAAMGDAGNGETQALKSCGSDAAPMNGNSSAAPPVVEMPVPLGKLVCSHSTSTLRGVPSASHFQDSFYEEVLTPPVESALSPRSFSRHKVGSFSAMVVEETEETTLAMADHCFRMSGRPVGKGAFGAVYRALDLETGVIVAVKQSRYPYDSSNRKPNWRELDTWSMVPMHPNVISFLGATVEEKTRQLLLVMEYAGGGSINALYQHFRPIPEKLFFNHANGIALGLKHLHDHSVIHGDVKPENVLTRSDGSVGISDFGCSRIHLRAHEGNVAARRLSWTNCYTLNSACSLELHGTVVYMAPEVIMDEPDLKSDVWAYACTLLYLWLSEPPWRACLDYLSARDIIPLMFHIANSDETPYSEAQLSCAPRWAQRIAQRAFERDLEKRCTMAEVLTILTEYKAV